MSIKVIILGSNSALPTSQRFSSAQVLNMLERYFLIDCAEGTQMQLRKTQIKFGKINNIFISHLHGDHYLGIFGLISTFNLLGRNTPLSIYAPSGFEKVLQFHREFIEHELQFEITFYPLEGTDKQLIFEDKKIEVFAFPLKHRIPTFGFLFTEKQKKPHIKKEIIEQYKLTIAEIKSIKDGSDLFLEDGTIITNKKLTADNTPPLSFAYCSDTIYNEAIIQHIQGVDLLYHESTFLKAYEKRAQETFHSTAEQAATIAKKAHVSKLIIGHFSARFHDTTPFLEEAQAIFKNTVLAEDCKEIIFDSQKESSI